MQHLWNDTGLPYVIGLVVFGIIVFSALQARSINRRRDENNRLTYDRTGNPFRDAQRSYEASRARREK